MEENVRSSRMDIAFVAQTKVCTFLLDAEGVCRFTIPRAGATAKEREAAELCLGAQYVASLDHTLEGLLAKEPKQGTRLLFARAGDDGRIRLVRSGPVLEFRMTEPDDEALVPTESARELPDDYGADEIRTLVTTKPLESEPATLRLVTPFARDAHAGPRPTPVKKPLSIVLRRGVLPRRNAGP